MSLFFTVIGKHALWLAIAWTFVIFVLCCTPGRYIPTTHWLELLSFDKLVHATIFFVLVILWLIAWKSSFKLTGFVCTLILFACILYGAALEVMQATVFSQRSGDWADFVANSFGCLMGLWLIKKASLS